MKRQRNGREKFIAKGPAVPWTARRVVLVSAPANGLKRVIRVPGKGAGTRRNDEERGRETALPRRVPAVLRRHGESGATGTVAASAAVDLDFRHQTLAVRPETACGFGGAYRVFSRLAECGSTTEPRQRVRSRRWPRGRLCEKKVRRRKSSSKMESTGQVWSDLIWSGLVWSGLVWSGLVRSGLRFALLFSVLNNAVPGRSQESKNGDQPA